MAKAKSQKFNIQIGFLNHDTNELVWIIDKVATLNQIVGKLPQVELECLAKIGCTIYKDDSNVYYNISKLS